MKIELKHLSPYLPYNLKMYCEQDKTTHILTISHQTFDLVSVGLYPLIKDEFYKTFKPLLRPLSDLTNEIIIGKEKFIPIEILFEKEHPRHLSKKYYNQVYYNYAIVSHNATAVDLKVYLNNLIEQNPRWIFEYLVRWHFDVFGLIEKGLAISINEINP